MEKDDLVFLLNTVADLSSHQNNGPVALASAKGAVKAYVADKEELQDPEILNAIDRLLKISSAAQVPGVFRPTSFNPTDYVDQPEEEEPIEVAPVAEPTPSTTEADDAEPLPEPAVQEPLPLPVEPEATKE